MIWPLIRLDLRKVLPVYLAIVAALAGFILVTREILDSTNITVAVLGLVQGWMLAYLIFRDPHNTQVFMFSRPWSRARVFWNRWALAIALQGATILLLYVILAAGTRTWLYKSELPHFPMIERFELSALWPIAVASIVTFHIIMFLICWGLCGGHQGSKSIHKRRGVGMVVKIAVVLILMTFLGGGHVVGMAVGDERRIDIRILALAYAITVIVMCTVASLNCQKHMEIES